MRLAYRLAIPVVATPTFAVCFFVFVEGGRAGGRRYVQDPREREARHPRDVASAVGGHDAGGGQGAGEIDNTTPTLVILSWSHQQYRFSHNKISIKLIAASTGPRVRSHLETALAWLVLFLVYYCRFRREIQHIVVVHVQGRKRRPKSRDDTGDMFKFHAVVVPIYGGKTGIYYTTAVYSATLQK